MSLPNPGMDFTPFDTLAAAELDDMVENIEALAAGTGLNVSAVTPEKLMTGTGTSWAWAAYTPTVTLNGGGSNGNATITGKFKQIGKTVRFTAKYVIGGTTSFAGLTSIDLSLPVTSVSMNTLSDVICLVDYLDAGTAHYYGIGTWKTTTSVNLVTLNVAGSYPVHANITSSVPFGWVAGDSFYINGAYEAA